jgi:hypothetical protein
MKIIWEAQDITPGRSYSREGIGETWLIGYLSYEDSRACYVSVSQNDGLVTKPMTPEEMAGMLTREGYLPSEVLNALTQGNKP